MNRLLLTFFLFVSSCLALKAQEYAIEIQTDKKIIYVDKLGMAGSTSVQDVLLLMPEVISRSGNDAFSNFDIQVDGKTASAGKDVTLEQTRISEVEKIEISITPSVAQQKNGQGGVINIVPKKLVEGHQGEAFVMGSTEWDFMPSVDWGYKKRNLELRGSLNMEYYRPVTEKYSEEIFGAQTVHVADSVCQKFCQQTAKFNLKYSFTDNDILKLWVIESSKRDRNENFQLKRTAETLSRDDRGVYQRVETEYDKVLKENNNLMVSVMSEYEHKFGTDGKFNVSGGYKYDNTYEGRLGKNPLVSTVSPYNVDGEVKYEQSVFTSGIHRLKLELGSNVNFSPTRSDTYNSSALYLSPFATVKYYVGDWTIHGGVRYQYFHRLYEPVGGQPYDKPDHDVTANLNTTWQVAPHHNLRLSLNRGLIRPADHMLYPLEILDVTKGVRIKGNPDLTNTYISYVDLNYVFDWSNDGHYLVMNADLGYNRADNIIEEKVVTPEDLHPTGFGPVFYTTYENTGTNDIAKMNLSLFYSKGIFSMSFAGNLFCNFMHRASGEDIYAYYNLSFTPIFNFKRQWVLSSKIMYNSPVEKMFSRLGDCFYMQIRVNKTIGQWTLHGEISDIFDYVSSDESRTVKDGVTRYYINAYDLYQRCLCLGVSYKF